MDIGQKCEKRLCSGWGVEISGNFALTVTSGTDKADHSTKYYRGFSESLFVRSWGTPKGGALYGSNKYRPYWGSQVDTKTGFMTTILNTYQLTSILLVQNVDLMLK